MAAKQDEMKSKPKGGRLPIADLAGVVLGLLWWRLSHGLEVITCDEGSPCTPAWHADTSAWQWKLVHGLTILGTVFAIAAIHCFFTGRRRLAFIAGGGFLVTGFAWLALFSG